MPGKNVKLTILMYHSVGEAPNKEVGADIYNISLDAFRQQMGYLYQNRYSVACLDNFEVNGKTQDVSKKIILTFDDGNITSFTNVFPVLKEYGFIGHFFVIVGYVNKKPGYINWEQLKTLKDAGMVIGSHGMTHRIFTELSDTEIETELRDSKKILEDNLGISIKCLSIPRGFYNKTIIQKAKDLGYKAIFTSEPSIITDSNFDLFRLPRIPIKKSLSFDRFIRILNGRKLMKEKLEDVFKKTSQGMLGTKYYDKLRTKVLER